MDFPFARLAEDIAEDRPAGSDLEMEGDADFMRFTAQIEGVLPASFASFDRAAVDLPAHLDEVGGLLKKSKDLRLLAAAAKLFILNRDLAGFEQCLAAAAHWLRERWDQIYPELMDGDAIMRSIALQSLDDVPHTVKPLEAAPLFKSRRAGAVSLRLALLAEGKMAPRQGEGGDDEKVPSQGDIASAIREAEIEEIVGARDHALRLAETLSEIEALWDEKTGTSGDLRFNELKPKVREVCAFLEQAAVARDPSLAKAPPEVAEGEHSGDGAGSVGFAPGSIADLEAAKAAMAAAERYFRRNEPSSPVRLVLAQAATLIGTSFYESLQQLVPEIAPQATVSLGRDLPLKLPLERLAQLLPTGDLDDAEDAPPEEEPAAEPAYHSYEETPEEGAGETEVAAEESAGDSTPAEDEAEQAAAESSDDSWETAPEGPAEPPPPSARARPRAATRADALALLDAAAAYFRTAEPSSPVPLLIDVARNAAGRDFLSLLRDALPPHALRVDE